MASIENRSRFRVTVQNRTDLSRTFAHNAATAAAAYAKELKAQGFKPKLSRLDDSFALRVRRVGHPNQPLFFKTAQEAVQKQQLMEAQRHQGLFVGYGKARRFTFADLLVRYVREESPCFQPKVLAQFRMQFGVRPGVYPPHAVRAPFAAPEKARGRSVR